MPTQEDYLARIEEYEDLLLRFLDLFQSSLRGNSTFEGGKTLLDIEVSDEVEDLLLTAEKYLDEGEMFEEEEDD